VGERNQEPNGYAERKLGKKRGNEKEEIESLTRGRWGGGFKALIF